MILARRRRLSPRPAIQAMEVPAPLGGLNTIAAGISMPPADCMAVYNLIASEYGLRSRLGSREWCTGLDSGAEVRSILPFSGSTPLGDRLFAVTPGGIWDVSASSAAPSQVATFTTTTGDAGYGVAHVVVTAGGHFLLYCDEANGLWTYTESTDTWAAVTMGVAAGQIDGVDPANLVFVTVFKGRVWFVERDSASAWYLDAGAIAGTATEFPMNGRLKAGGHLVGLWSWTYDGGSGLDDSLVGISSGGDVVVYQGTDPASASTFGLKGVWQVGAVPAGRHIATDFGGDLLLLTRMGILPMSRLVVGGEGQARYLTEKIASHFSALMLSRAALKGWAIRLHPEENALMVMVPTAEGSATNQLALALSRPSWWPFRDLPIYSADSWGGKFYFGTVDGRVLVNDGYVDGVTLADPNSYTPVQWSLLSAFSNLGNGRQKQVQIIRARFLSMSSTPDHTVGARYNLDLTELAPVSAAVGDDGAWDSAVWDTAEWGGDYTSSQSLNGTTGMGVDVAIAARGTATARTVLVGFDVMFTQGGLL